MQTETVLTLLEFICCFEIEAEETKIFLTLCLVRFNLLNAQYNNLVARGFYASDIMTMCHDLAVMSIKHVTNKAHVISSFLQGSFSKLLKCNCSKV